jgi:hypothetical protein
MRAARGPAGTPCLGVPILLLTGQVLTAQTSVLVEYRTEKRFYAYRLGASWTGQVIRFPRPKLRSWFAFVGDSQFGTSLGKVMRNASLRGRRVQVLRIHKDQDQRGCHLLFVNSSESKRYAKNLQAVPGADVLTVDEKPYFLTLCRALKFDVSLLGANEAYLRVSSRN